MTWAGVRPTTVLAALRRREPGFYEVSGLLRKHWPRVTRPRLYGAVFKSMVVTECFNRLRWAGVKPNGHQVYEVLA